MPEHGWRCGRERWEDDVKICQSEIPVCEVIWEGYVGAKVGSSVHHPDRGQLSKSEVEVNKWRT